VNVTSLGDKTQTAYSGHRRVFSSSADSDADTGQCQRRPKDRDYPSENHAKNGVTNHRPSKRTFKRRTAAWISSSTSEQATATEWASCGYKRQRPSVTRMKHLS
jgi:hypothetical protein